MQRKAINTKKTAGRSKIKFDRKLINGYIDKQLSVRAIADLEGCAASTIESHFRAKLKKRKNEEIIKRVGKRQQLREAQWDSAIEDKNTAMMIWLGKNELGQAEKIETTERQQKKGINVTHG